MTFESELKIPQNFKLHIQLEDNRVFNKPIRNNFLQKVKI